MAEWWRRRCLERKPEGGAARFWRTGGARRTAREVRDGSPTPSVRLLARKPPEQQFPEGSGQIRPPTALPALPLTEPLQNIRSSRGDCLWREGAQRRGSHRLQPRVNSSADPVAKAIDPSTPSPSRSAARSRAYRSRRPRELLLRFPRSTRRAQLPWPQRDSVHSAGPRRHWGGTVWTRRRVESRIERRGRRGCPRTAGGRRGT